MPRPSAVERARKPAAAAISHPLRVRILVVLNERDMSPSQFVEEDLAKGYFAGNRNLSQISYHFRELALAGCLEVVDLIPVRGAMEHVYRSSARALHSDEEWAALPQHQRRPITVATWQTLMARVESAILSDTFDRRNDRHLTWLPLKVDEQGWEELREVQAEAFARSEQIREESAERLEEADEPISIYATAAQLAFESPPPS